MTMRLSSPRASLRSLSQKNNKPGEVAAEVTASDADSAPMLSWFTLSSLSQLPRASSPSHLKLERSG